LVSLGEEGRGKREEGGGKREEGRGRREERRGKREFPIFNPQSLERGKGDLALGEG
jgi:hypothetical protein